MKHNRRNWKQKYAKNPQATQPQRRASVDVRADATKRRSKLRAGFHNLLQIGNRTSTRVWALFLSVAVILGFWLDVDDAISRRLRSKTPAAEIMYFRKTGSNYSLVDPANVVLLPPQRELDKDYVTVPINIAVRNQENARLDATPVEITYPKGLHVVPEGRPKIDPRNNTHIYEHDLRSLDPVTSLTPLDTIDVIRFRHAVKGLRTALILHDNIVGARIAVGVEVTDRPRGVDLQVKVFSLGRPPVIASLHLSIDSSRAFEDPDGSEDSFNPVPLRTSDVSLFRAVSKRLRASKRVWEVKAKGTSTTLAFVRTDHGQGSYNGLLLGGKVTEIFADSDGDGMLDYQLIDSTEKGSPDGRLLPSHPEPLTDLRRPDEVQLS